MLTVMKFGGSSMGSADALRKVADIIISTEGDKVVVVSAVAGVTNFLMGSVERDNIDYEDVLKSFSSVHLEIAEQLLEGEFMEEFLLEFNARMVSFEKALRGDVKDPFYKDAISSSGERFSSLILSHTLKAMGENSVALTSAAAGIHSIGIPFSGQADLKRTSEDINMKVRPIIDQGIIPIITGFYGMNHESKPLTFGRGGSDYSSAVVANALMADELQIWTDVDGFMSADPRMVNDAVRINEMNYGEAAELAYFGAKVLHPRTIEPARQRHIPVRVKNTFRPESPGTVIHHLKGPQNGLLMSVAAKTDLSIITIGSAEIAYRPGIVARIIDKFAEKNVIIYSISTSLSTVAFLVHNNDVQLILTQLDSLKKTDIEKINVKSDVALVCCVGDDLLDKCGVSGDIFGAVKEVGTNVEMISEGASDSSLNFVVPMEMLVSTVRKLHEEFVRE
ncbi:MAG TPA: aspartate kinase [Candidatus Methanomethylophilaceae archaeon]|nr:aspartate kinase [Candidatus Methanomethylophilaceae archaeon]